MSKDIGRELGEEAIKQSERWDTEEEGEDEDDEGDKEAGSLEKQRDDKEEGMEVTVDLTRKGRRTNKARVTRERPKGFYGPSRRARQAAKEEQSDVARENENDRQHVLR